MLVPAGKGVKKRAKVLRMVVLASGESKPSWRGSQPRTGWALHIRLPSRARVLSSSYMPKISVKSVFSPASKTVVERTAH